MELLDLTVSRGTDVVGEVENITKIVESKKMKSKIK